MIITKPVSSTDYEGILHKDRGDVYQVNIQPMFFEEIFFFFVYLVYIVIRIVGIVLLFLSSPIWGPIYFIIKLIREHTKK